MMAMGPGKYDQLCTEVREKARARAVIVIVFEGRHGSGFSCQADAMVTMSLPDILEQVASDIRRNEQQSHH